jgi:uncharacterized protein YndB with AHSA1/START domain
MTGPGNVEVSVHVAASPETTFAYLTDPARYVQWMGSHANLEPIPGGTYQVQMADGFAAAGTFTEIDPPRRLAFTWGWADDEAAQHVLHEQHEQTAPDGQALAPGSTRVVITLGDEDGGTRLTLHHHELATSDLVQAHQVAWETYLDRLRIRAAGGDPGPDPHL